MSRIMVDSSLVIAVLGSMFVGIIFGEPGWAVFSLIAIDFLLKNKGE